MSIPRPDLGAIALAVFFALAPGIAVGGALGFAVLVTLVGLASVRPSFFRQLIENRSTFIGLLVVFGLWAGIASTWSPHAAGEQALKFASQILGGLLFATFASGPGARLSLAGAAAAALILIPLMAIEALTPLLITRTAQPDVTNPVELTRNLSRGAAFLVTIGWSAAGALILMGRAWTVLGLALITGIGVISAQFGATANLVAFGAGLLAFGVGRLAPYASIWLASGGLAAWVLTAPFATPLPFASDSIADALPQSWAHRIEIWRYTIDRIHENMLVGHGFEASRAVEATVLVRGIPSAAIANHPHSASLQIWFELGGIGAALAALTLLAGGWWLSRAYRHRPLAAAAACGTLATAGVIANISFSAWAEWWIATLFIAAGVVGAIGALEAPRERAVG